MRCSPVERPASARRADARADVGMAPAEVFFGRLLREGPIERVSYFEGLLPWWRFG